MERTRENDQDELCRLLTRARSGDREAFKAIVRLYQQKVFLLAFSFLRNREDALDIVQETFMKLFQKLHVFNSGGNFQAWLLQMARNLTIDYYRKHHLQRKEREVERAKGQLELPGEGEASGESASDLSQALSRSLQRLASKQRMVFVMKHYTGLQYKEIAQVLDISVGTVKSLHFKAIRNMRKLLSPQLGIRS